MKLYYKTKALTSSSIAVFYWVDEAYIRTAGLPILSAEIYISTNKIVETYFSLFFPQHELVEVA